MSHAIGKSFPPHISYITQKISIIHQFASIYTVKQSFKSSPFVFSFSHLWQLRKNNLKIIRRPFWKWKAKPWLPNDTEKQKDKKSNTTCNSHSAVISAQRCSSKILSKTASSCFLLAQDSPDTPTDILCAICPKDSVWKPEGYTAKQCLQLPCALAWGVPSHQRFPVTTRLSEGCWWHFRVSSPPASQGEEGEAIGAVGRGWCHSCTHCQWHVCRR